MAISLYAILASSIVKKINIKSYNSACTIWTITVELLFTLYILSLCASRRVEPVTMKTGVDAN